MLPFRRWRLHVGELAQFFGEEPALLIGQQKDIVIWRAQRQRPSEFFDIAPDAPGRAGKWCGVDGDSQGASLGRGAWWTVLETR
jgi:hypothetical protein